MSSTTTTTLPPTTTTTTTTVTTTAPPTTTTVTTTTTPAPPDWTAAPSDGVALTDFFDWAIYPPTSSTTTSSSTTTDPPFSIDSPAAWDDGFVSGLCPSGSAVQVLLEPGGALFDADVYDTVWVAAMDLSAALEVWATIDGWASHLSEPVAQATTTTTAPTTATTAEATTEPPTTTAPPEPPTTVAIAHGNKVVFAEVSGTSISLGEDVEFSALPPECLSLAAMGAGRLAIAYGRGCGRARVASAGGILAEDVTLGEESQIPGTSKGVCGGGLSAMRSDPLWMAVAYADAGDCRGTVSRAAVGGYAVTTTTSTTTTTTTGTTTTTVTTTTTAPPGSTTTAPPPPGAERRFRLASPFF